MKVRILEKNQEMSVNLIPGNQQLPCKLEFFWFSILFLPLIFSYTGSHAES